MFIGYPVLQDPDSLIVQKDGWEDQTLVTTQATGVNWSLRTPWVLEDHLLGTAATIIALPRQNKIKTTALSTQLYLKNMVL